MKNPDESLKPCPFCGGRKLTFIEYRNMKMLDGSQGEKVFCLLCGGASGISTHEDAIKSWNERKVTE